MLAVSDKLIPTLVETGEPLARRQDRFRGRRLQALRHGGEHLRIDRIGLGEEAGRTGEVAGARRVDASKAYSGYRQGLAQVEVVPAGRLEQNEGVTPRPGLGHFSHRAGRIAQPDGHACRTVEHIEIMLGDIDSNKAKGL